MNRAKKEHTSPPAIKVVLKEEEMQRIRKGPLRETEGRGAATWARKLILKELDQYESVESGNSQFNVESIR